MTEVTSMDEAPLVAAWHRARDRHMHPLQIPGHKNQYSTDNDTWGADLLAPLVRDDIPLQGGVDDNAFSGKFLEQAEALWSRAVGADHSRFLVGGSTQGNISAITSVVGPGQVIAIDRTSHRSTQAALVISGAEPAWIFPELHPEFGLPVGMPVSAVNSVATDARAAFITSPSYVGTLSDVEAVASACHDRQIPLIVDQAWGAHLGFMEGRGALALGADLSVTSVHKTLLGYSQTAVVTMRDGRVARLALDRAVDMVATTSPSGTLMASIDATRALLERDGAARCEATEELVQGMRDALSKVEGLVVLENADVAFGMDPFKVTLWLPRTGADGTALGARLWDLGMGPESADRDTLVLTISPVDTPEFVASATEALVGLIEAARDAPRSAAETSVWRVDPEVVCTPREAFFAKRRRLDLDDAVGEVSAEQLCPYPPGVPIIAPGERITRESVDAIRSAARDVRVAYGSDPTLRTIEVIDSLT